MKELKEKLEALQDKLQATEQEIDNYEVDCDDQVVINQYEDMLNSEGDIKVCGFTFDASEIIGQLDPTAYRCGLLDFIDGIDPSQFENFTELQERVSEISTEIEEVEAKIEALQE